MSPLDNYQHLAARTLARRPLSEYSPAELEKKLAVMGLGIAGEAGEVADLIKKHVGHGHPLDPEKLTAELGDVLWYIAAFCTLLDWELSDVAEANIAKLRTRYPAGFDPERSKNRGLEDRP